MENFSDGGQVCEHLFDFEKSIEDAYYYFTGVGTAYHLVCKMCKDSEDPARHLVANSAGAFAEWETFVREGFIGIPEVLSRETGLQFEHNLVALEMPVNSEVRAAQPANNRHNWFVLLASGDMVILDSLARQVRKIAHIPPIQYALLDKLEIHVSPDAVRTRPQKVLLRISPLNDFAVVANEFSQTGLVIDLSTGQVTMTLDRGTYHIEHCVFPAAFFTFAGKTHLIHGTNWHRLDISDPATGELLTARTLVGRPTPEKLPEHYLDYFHGRLVVSPDQRWIVEDGWFWHPAGITRSWNVEQWITENIWESEDGVSSHTYAQCWYSWDRPLCWIDDTTFALWGFGDDDDWHFPAARLHEVVSGKRKHWFAGVQRGDFYFDRYLYSASQNGTEVWDIYSGERLHTDPTLSPISYHPVSHEFLSILPSGAFRISRLSGEA